MGGRSIDSQTSGKFADLCFVSKKPKSGALENDHLSSEIGMAPISWKKLFRNFETDQKRIINNQNPRWFKVTFLSRGWRSLNPWKGHLTIPKRSPAELPGLYGFLSQQWLRSRVRTLSPPSPPEKGTLSPPFKPPTNLFPREMGGFWGGQVKSQLDLRIYSYVAVFFFQSRGSLGVVSCIRCIPLLSWKDCEPHIRRWFFMIAGNYRCTINWMI